MDAADDVVSDAWEVAHSAASDKNDAMLLKVMTLAANIGDDLLAR